MNKIHLEEILLYNYCPMAYKFKYIDKVSDNSINIEEEYNKAFKKTIYGFLVSSQDSNPDFSTIKNIWGRLWIKQKKIIELIYEKPKSWRDTHNEKRKLGIYSLKNFYDYYSKTPSFPILFNKEYECNIDDIILVGNFDIIREVDSKIQIINIKSSSRHFNSIHIDKDIETTAMIYAFRELFKIKEDDVLIYNAEKSKRRHTARSDKDFKMLEDVIVGIKKCIDQNIFYSCPNYKCHNCSYKIKCLNS